MYFIALVTSFSDKRDSAYRVAPLDIRKSGGRLYLINPNRLHDIIVDPNDADKSQFKLFDNHLDRRESWAYVKANISVAEIEAADNTAFFSNMITLDIHRNNDPNKATVATTMPVSCIAWAKEYNRDNDHIWICYVNGAFRRKEVLCHMTLEGLEDIAETGTSTTTSTTTTAQ